MKRNAHTANSSLTETTTNNNSSKRCCTEKDNKNCVTSNSLTASSSSLIDNISCSVVSSSTSTENLLNMEENVETLISMGFTDRDLNRKALEKAGNDIGDAVTFLTGSTFFNDDVSIPNESRTTSTFIGPLTKEQMEQQQQQQQIVSSDKISDMSTDDLSMNNPNSFTKNAFLDLETKVYGDNWSIPYKREEVLGRCLLSATKLAVAGIADQDEHCKKFMEILIPDAFRKLQCSHHVNNWGVEVQLGVFDMVQLVIDLIAARLSYFPVPIQLLETLAILFDHDSVFQRKHKSKSYDRSLYDKQLGELILANSSSPTFSVYNRNEPYGWLCEIINRFILKDGIQNLKIQFKSEQPLTALEYNALLSPFVNCMDYIFVEKYRQLFSDNIEQALDYVKNLKEEDFKAKSTNTIFELLTTLRKICSVVWTKRLEQVEELHLNLLLKMVALSNFNAKMNSLKELAKIIENCTSNIPSITKASIPRDVVSEWVIEHSILSKALEGNIDQNQYVEKVRTLMDFIAPRILKEDIETIWKMQHGRSLVAVDHLFTLIASAAAKFNLEQLNHLIGFIHSSWKSETVLIQEKLIELLGAIGRECQKDSAARVLEVLWDMAHEDRISRSMLDHLLHCHLRVFSEGRSPYDALKREYCLKCMTDLQRKQGWLVPAIKHLYDLLRHDSTNTFKRSEPDLISLLVNKHDVISALIQSLSTCQFDVWNKTHGHVTIDTLVDGRFTHEESIKTHLDLLSFLLKKGNLYLILKRSEELWDTLITNENASSFDRELGLNWFITCVEDLSRDSQLALFEKRVSKLDPVHLSLKGYACFKLYFERCNLERWSQSRTFNHNSNASTSSNNEMLDHQCIDELWSIILCAGDDNLANDATRFLLDLYCTKQPNRTCRPTSQSLHECFLKEVYTRLSSLLISADLPLTSSTSTTEQYYKSLKSYGEQLISIDNSITINESSNEIDHQLWLQKIERLFMITEEYIHVVEHENSLNAHITSFHGLEYQIKIILGELGKTNCPYDIVIVHSNDTLDMLRARLGLHYKVPSHDIHISIQNTRPLPQSYDHLGPINNAIALPANNSSSSTSSTSTNNNNNVLGLWLNSKYLYQVHITPGTTVYIKILGNTYNQTTKINNSEPTRLFLCHKSQNIDNDNLTRSTPSNMMAENPKVYDILYKLSYLNDKNIHNRIRNLLRLMPSDIRIVDLLDLVSIRAASVSTNERRQSTENMNSRQINPKQAIEYVFNFDECSLIKILYNLEILSSKLSPLSNNIGIKQSSKLFRQDFIEQAGVEFLFKLLQSLNHFIHDDYQYSLCQEITILVLQLIQLLLCGNNQPEEILSPPPPPSSSSSRPTSPVAIAANDSIIDTIDFDFQAKIEHLQFEEFVEQIKQLIFLCWAAAAGNIRLHGHVLSIKEQVKLDRHVLLKQINGNVFCRNNSKNSSSNDSTTTNILNTVQYGICVKKGSILPLDSEIAERIIDIVMFCFEKRPEFIATFLIQPFFADFLLEILISTSSREVRQCALRNIIRLCKIETHACDISAIIHQILLKARLPLWPSSATNRSSSQKLLLQSIEYFDLRCQLTENLTKQMQTILNIDAKEILTNEFNWLSSYTASITSSELRTIDNILFVGHLRFIRTLLTCENINKIEFGIDFIRLIIDQFLFPASKRMSQPIVPSNNENDLLDDSAPEPKCSTSESRLAAYDVLVELVRNCRTNLKLVVNDLIHLHHRPILEKQTEWEFMPQVNPRASCGLVGLHNGGATCYMNSILQQLYMLPQISEHILSVHDDLENTNGISKTNDSSLFYQLQQVFGHLMESKMQYYSPECLWKVFRLWGQEINVREQQDAFDFFTAMTDQIDEYLKSMKQEEIFRKQFEGIFCNQMICTNGCRHRYEGEEKFMALNVAVKVDSLNESLNQFVKGEVLDGNNAYFCAKCQEKRTTIKRLCIKKLPPILCIQMKRFGFDWENNRALKFDDYFKFPLILNMEPYTLDGVNKRESFVEHDDLTSNSNNVSLINTTTTIGDNKCLSRSLSSLNNPSANMPTINYELIGIVIHSGQANAGHYYSFIKDIRRRHSNNANQWYRFNDTSVEEIQLTEQMLEEECFGGTFRVQKDNNNSNEERTRFWNAYMLIYQCIEPSKLLPPPLAIPSSPNTNRSSRYVPGTAVRVNCTNQRDSLSQLADLVVRSENSDLFKIENPLIPSRVLACVKDENLEFLKNRDTYCDDYFQFIYKLSKICFDDINIPPDMEIVEKENEETSYELCTKLALNFLFNTHLRTHRRLRKDNLQQWVQLLSRLFTKNSTSCLIFYDLLFEKHDHGLKLYLLDCPIDDIRYIFEQICEQVLQATYFHVLEKNQQIHEANLNDNHETLIINIDNNLLILMRKFIEQLINLLDKAVVEQVKHSQGYFQLIYSYMKMNKNSIDDLLKLNTFTRLMNFLLGENIGARRWNSGQAKEFGIIHEIIATLVLAGNLTKETSNEQDLQLKNQMEIYFYGKCANRYLKEICYAFQEISPSQLICTVQLMEILSLANLSFSEQLIRIILQTIAQAHTNDLKSLFKFLSFILLVEDSLQTKRLQITFEGINESISGDNSQNLTGLYSLIRTSMETEQRRTYQTVKFLINLSNRNSSCKEYFASTAIQWEFAISWLKQQMQTSWQWSPAQNVSNEDTDTRSFQRTRSAQYTLEQAQSLLQQTTTTTSSSNNDTSTTELMELNDNHSQSSSQSTLVGID
ncbi:unnamed protein product [Rotaria magnacalcarata]|uniref:Ubiquitinyl hydrolase 1 n=4 Tax=Rotaria magnacalcarata TaxID=392030 RepID=A0A816PV93_9BILA|nr:unnamed protein product [Rotaria magnacalcarata]